jgi:hypothetical protein
MTKARVEKQAGENRAMQETQANKPTIVQRLDDVLNDVYLDVSRVHSLCWAAEQLLMNERLDPKITRAEAVDRVIYLLQLANGINVLLKQRLDV